MGCENGEGASGDNRGRFEGGPCVLYVGENCGWGDGEENGIEFVGD